MSEAMEYLLAIQRMIETAQTDGIINGQLCQKAADKVDEAFAAIDEAAKAQKKHESVYGF